MRFLLPALACFFFLTGCCGLFSDTPIPPPMELTFSVALDPSLTLYAVDWDANRITSTDSNFRFYPVQRGLPAGTLYTFRLIYPNDEVAVPANENFTALPSSEEPNFQAGLQQYYGYPPGKYAIELVTIEGSHGKIVARTFIRITRANETSPEDVRLVMQNCSHLLPPGNSIFQSLDSSEAFALAICIRDMAIVQNNPEICKAVIPYFNEGMFISDACFEDYAVNKSDLSLCGKRERAVDKALCRAKITGDMQECLTFQCDFYWSCDDQRDVCLANFNILRNDVSICRMLKGDDMRNRCLGGALLDKSYCNQITANESRESCLRNIDEMPPQN